MAVRKSVGSSNDETFGFMKLGQNIRPCCISRCSAIGPRLSAGKNVSAPMIRITAISKQAKVAPSVGNVPAVTGAIFFGARLPAIASAGMMTPKRPSSITTPST